MEILSSTETIVGVIRGVRGLLFRRGGAKIFGPPLGNIGPPPLKTPFLKKY